MTPSGMDAKMEERAREIANSIIDKKLWVESGASARFCNLMRRDIQKALLDFHAQESNFLVQEIEHWMANGIPIAVETKEAIAEIEALKPHSGRDQ